MTDDHTAWSRRTFLKTAGIGTALVPALAYGAGPSAEARVPIRPFGRTGANVSILSLGGMFDIPSNQLVLRQALNWGVTYWDTANSYGGGRSETGIGKYLERYPQDRPKIFLVTKSGAWSTGGLTRHLELSLERMKTDCIDLFFVHAVSDIDQMDPDVKQWAEKAKRAGKIRFMGFSTHSNMAGCLAGAARLGWIDGIMMSYNYRLMHSDDMRRAVEACHKAGIGLTAMKTQGGGQVRTHTEQEMQLAGRFLEKGYTDAQAKLKAVWEDPRIASICSQMPNMTILMANAAAAMNKVQLSRRDLNSLRKLAAATATDYCRGCAAVCESAVYGHVPIADVMRYLMYHRSYGETAHAADRFRRLSPAIQKRLAAGDFSRAEQACPQRMPIGRLMRAAVAELA